MKDELVASHPAVKYQMPIRHCVQMLGVRRIEADQIPPLLSFVDLHSWWPRISCWPLPKKSQLNIMIRSINLPPQFDALIIKGGDHNEHVISRFKSLDSEYCSAQKVFKVLET